MEKWRAIRSKTMFSRKMISMLALAGAMFVPAAFALAPHANPGNEPAGGKAAPSSHYRPANVPTRAKDYYASVWGVDNFLVRRTASGSLIRFSYRVTDPTRARPLGDHALTPLMIGERSRVVLQIPVMENIGQLRQAGIPQAGKEYWMVFSNKGQPVKAGDRVSVIIGSFHADGLLVE